MTAEIFIQPVGRILRLSTDWRVPLRIHSFPKPCVDIIQSFTAQCLAGPALWTDVILFPWNVSSYFPCNSCAFYSFHNSLTLKKKSYFNNTKTSALKFSVLSNRNFISVFDAICSQLVEEVHEVLSNTDKNFQNIYLSKKFLRHHQLSQCLQRNKADVAWSWTLT
jgi:hypothetical protein